MRTVMSPPWPPRAEDAAINDASVNRPQTPNGWTLPVGTTSRKLSFASKKRPKRTHRFGELLHFLLVDGLLLHENWVCWPATATEQGPQLVFGKADPLSLRQTTGLLLGGRGGLWLRFALGRRFGIRGLWDFLLLSIQAPQPAFDGHARRLHLALADEKAWRVYMSLRCPYLLVSRQGPKVTVERQEVQKSYGHFSDVGQTACAQHATPMYIGTKLAIPTDTALE